MSDKPYKKIIIIDDDEDLLKLLRFAFKEKGFEVKTFSLGQEALKFLINESNLYGCELIILDRMIPDINGLDILTAYLRATKRKIPVLILSALSSEQEILNGLKKGAIDYVTKPFNLPFLMQKAMELIRLSE